ncbi:hypothetical protein KIPB_000046 [Kipferlia bialata]|uniref:DSBA-like thioredoxin domain-containing protein n=1 Tax=Kipferlia bialata TaxID=797122 RepID=A0A9K3CND8_9EUKA|nr:hypothetical protein KIPB_000046 [Kipferlia bialata]|eukprot:g46.t1
MAGGIGAAAPSGCEDSEIQGVFRDAMPNHPVFQALVGGADVDTVLAAAKGAVLPFGMGVVHAATVCGRRDVLEAVVRVQPLCLLSVVSLPLPLGDVLPLHLACMGTSSTEGVSEGVVGWILDEMERVWGERECVRQRVLSMSYGVSPFYLACASGAEGVCHVCLDRMLRSMMANLIMSPRLRDKRHKKAERLRVKQGRPHVIHYFHQVNDPYSALAVQCIPTILARYAIFVECHLVSAIEGGDLPEPELFARLALHDAKAIAPGMGVSFPQTAQTPTPEAEAEAQRRLAEVIGDPVLFARCASECTAWLWDNSATVSLAEAETEEEREGERENAQLLVEEGNALRLDMGHYSSGMFYYEGEWYWGVDRMYHLEQRLMKLDLERHELRQEHPVAKTETNPYGYSYPRPPIVRGRVAHPEGLTLEIYPSLRSPYTAVGFDTAVSIAKEAGIAYEVRPVLPMVMRGMTISRNKGRYIMRDAKREADAQGIPFGNMYDPVGRPVLTAFSLLPWVIKQGKEAEFISAFLSAAFPKGTNTSSLKGLRTVVEAAGLDWEVAQTHITDAELKRGHALLAANRESMISDLGLWGVPSFRLRGRADSDYVVLGQDKLWRLAQEVQTRGQ